MIPKMIEYMKTADMIIASRYAKGGGIDVSWSFSREFVSKGAISLIKPLTSAKDPMSGFFFIKKRKLKKEKLEPTSCKICLEILVKCKINNFKEVPYIFVNRKVGKSKIMNTTEIARYLKHVIKLYFFKLTNS